MENFEKEEVEPLPSIEDPEEAQDFIERRFEEGERPFVSVPNEYIESLTAGLSPHTSWIPELSLIAATFDRKPYLPEDESRILVRIVGIDKEQIHPRFTGPDKKFHGVVTIDGPIPPEMLEIVAQNLQI